MKHAHRGPAQFTFKVKKQMDEKFVCMCVCVCVCVFSAACVWADLYDLQKFSDGYINKY